MESLDKCLKRLANVLIGIVFSVFTFILGSVISADSPANLAIATFGAPWGIMFAFWPVIVFMWNRRSWVAVFSVMVVNTVSGVIYLFIVYDLSSMLQLQHGFVGALSIGYALSWVLVSVAIYYVLSEKSAGGEK